MKLAKSKYLSEIINNNSHCPKTIFSTIDYVLNPTVDVFIDVSETLCENFLTFFVEKVDRLRSQVLQSVSDIIERPWSSAKWSNFQPVTISACKDIIEHLRPTVCPFDVMPARFLKQVVHIVGSDVLNLVNLSLSTGMVPDSPEMCLNNANFKKAKFRHVDFSNFRPVSNLSLCPKFGESCSSSATSLFEI